MLKNQKGFHVFPVLLIIVIAVVVGAGLFVINKNTNKSDGRRGSHGPAPSEQGPNYKALAACGSTPVLTVAPMDLSKLDSISPLGAINPPEHTQPTDHMYFMFKYDHGDERYDVVAPGNIVVTAIGYSGEVENGQHKNTDYSIDFSACKGVSFRLSHVNTLQGILKGEVGLDGKGADCRQDSPVAGKVKLNCGKNVDTTVKAGELIGRVGDPYVAAMDVWAHKSDYVNPNMITPEYSFSFDSVCPVDYYTPEIQAKIYALVSRTAKPRCGEIGQDKKDTLQGTWYSHKDPKQAQTDWNSHLTLAHNNADPGIGVLAVGGKLADPYIYNFAPKHSGTINREPSETAAGTVYCYQHDGNRRLSNGSMAGEGKTLFKLVDNHTAQVEYKSGSCGATETLGSPTTYYR